jgi:hypothetical protein
MKYEKTFLCFSLSALVFAAGCASPKIDQVTRVSAPPQGKSLVNIHRPSNAAGNLKYPIFRGDGQMLCDMPAKALFQYVCDPGELILISWGERVTVIQADLAPDKVYDIMADFRLGWVRNDFALVPLLKGDPRRAKLPEFEKREKFTVGPERTERMMQYEAKHKARIEEIRRDFLGGDKSDRVKKISKDDCR